MGFLSVIRRWALRDKVPIREIARRTGLSRNTIRKHLREGAVEPKFKTPSIPAEQAGPLCGSAAFRVFGGVPGRGIYDNMKTAVDRVGKGKRRDVNAHFKSMASHYVFEPEFCNPAAGWEKGQVEKNVQDARNRLWQIMPVFNDLAELNQWLEDRCIAL